MHANQPRVIPNIAVCGGNVDASWRARNLDSKTAAALDQRFDGVITTETDLREIVGPANRWFTSKILNRLDLAVIVKAEKAFFHCGKCITRSKLWYSRL